MCNMEALFAITTSGLQDKSKLEHTNPDGAFSPQEQIGGR